jgi:hypothetical protein
MMTRSKPREWKDKSGLKRRLQTESKPKMKKAIKNALIPTLA